jgi:hypothetical protein
LGSSACETCSASTFAGTRRSKLVWLYALERPRSGAENVVRVTDGGAGLAAATIKRRLAAV